MYNIDRREYIRIRNKIENFINEVSNYYQIPHEMLRCNHYETYCEEQLNVIINIHQFESNAGKLISGLIDKIDEFYIITLNNSDMYERQNFTLMHELIHRRFHFDGDSNVKFAEFKDKSCYNKSDLTYELEANIGASLLIANDYVIEDLLYKRFNFYQMCNELQCSKNALQTRLINYFQYNLYGTNKAAYDIVYSFRGGSTELFDAFNYCKQLESDLQQEYRAYYI